ncbi:MAG: hypothetical protein IJW36_00615 [Clostridia bacterium]|nr:hypothetical protein [Clostridia bacterium]
MEKNFLAFRLLNRTEQLTLVNNVIKKDFKSRILNNSIIYKKNNKTHLILIATHIEKVNEFEFVNLLQGIKNVDEIEIICNDFNPILNSRILNGININFITKNKLYDEFFFKHSIYPDTKILNTKTERKKMKEILKNFFIPVRAKSYFLCGLILIFSSIILPYHTYYLIFGSTLLILSIICKLQPIFKR